MAPKGTKRAQAGAKASAQTEKKARVEKPGGKSKFQPVLDGIHQATHLSDSCRQMLLSMVPCSLGTFADKRHATHQIGVKLIGAALADVASNLQQAVEEQNAKLKESEEAISQLLVKLKAAEEAYVAAETAENEKKQVLGELERSVESASATLKQKQDAQRSGDAALDAAQGQKDKIIRALVEDLTPIASGELEPATAEAHCKALMPAITLLTLEDSLTTALPAACVKPKDQRGMFDNMVLDQLEKSFTAKVEDLTRLLDEGAAAKRERAEAVETAAAALESAKGSKQSAAEQLAATQEALEQAGEEASIVGLNVGAYGPQRLVMTKTRDKKVALLETFKVYNLCAFEMMRDAVSKPPAPPQDSEAIAQEAAVEAPVKEPGEVQP